MLHPRFRLTLVAATCCCLLFTSCGTPGKKEKPHAKSIDRQGLQAVAILAGYLFPRGWDEKLGVSMARRMFPLEYHGNAFMGKTLIQSKVEFDGGALNRLLADVQKTTPTFTSNADMDHPFGKDSHQTIDEKGSKRQLDWWKPAKHKDAKYYFWSTNYPNEPTTRIWLQVSDEKHNAKQVYVRIESE